MKLERFRVRGLRCLEDTDWIPVACPTILTGVNDGGKTTALLALEFLLSGRNIKDSDFTGEQSDNQEDGPAPTDQMDECSVEGLFRLPDGEMDELSLPGETLLRRRRQRSESSCTLQVRTTVPEDERLRGIEASNLGELKIIADALGVEPDGHAGHRESYLNPLRGLASSQPLVEAWRDATKQEERALPRMISFASTAEPDPASDIREALREAYSLALEDDSIVGLVREAEEQVRRRLEDEAGALREHIVGRCPELQDLTIEPRVSFREGFTGVELSSTRPDGISVPLAASGAGTRRRINLATWEWTRLLIELAEPQARGLIVAYDEPDTHLDYRHQRELVDLIRSQCERPGVRVVVATHSLNLIDKIPIENVVHLELLDGRTRVTQLFGTGHDDFDRHLQAIATSMGLSNSVLLHERCFLGVEGVTERQAIPLLFRTATGMSLQAAGIALVHAGGNSGARELCKFLNDLGREVRFIVDRDSEGKKVFKPEALEKAGISPVQMYLVGSPSEIEDLFTDQQWARTAAKHWRRDDGNEWVPDQFGGLRVEGKFSEKLHSMLGDASKDAPTSKAALLPTLVGELEDANEVPDQLREVFQQLLEVTSAR